MSTDAAPSRIPHTANGELSTGDSRLVQAALARAERWTRDARHTPVPVASRLMNHLLAQDGGLRFLTELLDGLFRPEDLRIAAESLVRAQQSVPSAATPPLRWSVAAGAVAARVAPTLTARGARFIVQALMGHLVVDVRPRQLSKALRSIRRDGTRVNLNLLGEAVLGRREAAKRVETTRTLIRHPDVDYVSIKVSAAVAPHSRWAFAEAVDDIVEALAPLYRDAVDHGGVFVNLDMEEYHDLDLTVAVFTRLMDDPQFRGLSAGLVLQAYLPDSLQALTELQTYSQRRSSAGGAPLKVRIVKGANLSMERVHAELHGWRQAPWDSKAQSDAHYKRLINQALSADTASSLRVGVAGHNLFDIAWAFELALSRGLTDSMDVEMLLGMAPGAVAAVSEDAGPVRLYTPAVNPHDFDVALAYLARRLEEVASPGNYLADAARAGSHREALDAQREAFLESVAVMTDPPSRTRGREVTSVEPWDLGNTFANAADTDPSVWEQREAMRSVLDRARTSMAGVDTLAAAHVAESSALDQVVGRVQTAGKVWSQSSPQTRAEVLSRMADALERNRARLVEVMVSEAGKTPDQADPEVSEAVDFARYYAASALSLSDGVGAIAQSHAVTLVTPPWNFPVAIPAGSTMAAVAAGSAVLLKPAPEAGRCGAVLWEVLQEANPPQSVIQLLSLDTDVLGSDLIGDERIEQVILTGAYETAQHFLNHRPTLDVRAETSGKNALVITPHADLDVAVADLVASAFGHAGQKCSAASLAVLVGSVGRSDRFRNQLIDAVTSLKVGEAWDPTTDMGPVIVPPQGKLARALTSLEDGESWWVEPQRVTDTLWTPGVRAGVQPGSFFHLTECFGPILGLICVETFDEALQVVNAVDYGLTAGLHSLDPKEMALWVDTVQAGNVYVNRTTTGAIVQRQPFGGWKRSVVGPTVKAGGPHYVGSLARWAADHDATSVSAEVTPVATLLEPAIEQAGSIVTDADRDRLLRSFAADQRAWQEQFGRGHDPSGLRSEVNVYRYRALPATIRWDGASHTDVLRTIGASIRATGQATLSIPPTVSSAALEALSAAVDIHREPAEAAVRRARTVGRVRVVGTVEPELRGHADLAVYSSAATINAERELLPFLREQSVSVCAHRYGTPFAPALALKAALIQGAVDSQN
ncbi:bifunctional proline dehydrogenase/L-glutamate gamma-semialdehyde dehydrogenase [Demequina sp. B12]|uniref:bifunctional proline dehydrogenase/L-glutamate gamma-semialdehyde dehydrogenase n=1 Tax=Demequina sp. B12 TaxID=2992757 RepID=UPI00237A58D5|nr:bifunctional proline dehydrogenase/L-glutamate gamma-semialdehyde dehydrogenase [Demequina sp. B12]MDE0573101.1 bifunctional proline dehydrogenase/L-glutamate gamma-semialdehyde dehydrogenase [Demequina sp. B12]